VPTPPSHLPRRIPRRSHQLSPLQLHPQSHISPTHLHSVLLPAIRRICPPLRLRKPNITDYPSRIFMVPLNPRPNHSRLPSNSDPAGAALPVAPRLPHPHIFDIPPVPPAPRSCGMRFWSTMFNLSRCSIKQFTRFQKTFGYEDNHSRSSQSCRLLSTVPIH
jgi:hypothetical protein